MTKQASPVIPAISAVVLIGLIAACLWWLFSLPSTVRPERSAYGFDGLAVWLRANDMDARSFAGGGQLDAEGVGLRILPVLDDRTDRVGEHLTSPAEPHLRGEIRHMWESVIAEKADRIPTLIVLPKWRDGMRLGGVIHPEFLLPSSQTMPAGTELQDEEEEESAALEQEEEKSDVLAELDAQLFVDTDDMIVLDAEIATSDIHRIAAGPPYQVEAVFLSGLIDGTATLYAPQYAQAPQQCVTLLDSPDGALLFSCTSEGRSFWVLSDPDLLNNHGLARGENASLAVALVRELAGDGSVLIDYSTQVWALPEDLNAGRSWADLMRYFEPPFAWLWLAGFLFMILLVWRGGVRGVPLIRRFSEGHGAARMTALAAQARLLRRARADGALLKSLRTSYIHTLAERMMGRNTPKENRRDRVIRVLRHREAGVADDLEAAFAAIDDLPSDAAAGRTVPVLAQLQSAYKKALKLT